MIIDSNIKRNVKFIKNPIDWGCKCDNDLELIIIGKLNRRKQVGNFAYRFKKIEPVYKYVCKECGNIKSGVLHEKYLSYIIKAKGLDKNNFEKLNTIISSSNRENYIKDKKNEPSSIKKTPSYLERKRNKLDKNINRFFEKIKEFNKKRDEFFWEEYKKYLESDEWYKKRKKRLILDNHKCRKCKSNNDILQIHHLSYENIKIDISLEDWLKGEEFTIKFEEDIKKDLITLCKNCHEKYHKDDVLYFE